MSPYRTPQGRAPKPMLRWQRWVEVLYALFYKRGLRRTARLPRMGPRCEFNVSTLPHLLH